MMISLMQKWSKEKMTGVSVCVLDFEKLQLQLYLRSSNPYLYPGTITLSQLDEQKKKIPASNIYLATLI